MARKSSARVRERKRREAEERRQEEARRQQAKALGIGAAIVAGVVIALIALWPEPATGDTSQEAWDLPQLDGDGRVALANFAGSPTVAAFFASWCVVCEQEIPELLALSRELGDAVDFVGINSQDNGQGLSDAQKWGIAGEWPLARDIGNGNGSSLSVQSFGARGSPTNVIYNAAGEVVHVQQGGISPDELLRLLDELTEFEA